MIRREPARFHRPQQLFAALVAALALGSTTAAADVASGSYNGNGGATQSISTVPFQPDLLIVKSEDGEVAVARTRTMTGSNSKPLVGGTALQTDMILSLDPSGFTVGSNDAVNASGITFHWIAFREVAGIMKTGTYVGDDSGNRVISPLGLDPKMIVVMAETAQEAVHRTGSSSSSFNFDRGSGMSNVLTTPVPTNGFRIGSDDRVNTGGVTYHYVCWPQIAGRQVFGSYIGDGNAVHEVTIPGLRPEYVIVRDVSTGRDTTHHPESLGRLTDSTLYFSSTAANNDLITALLPGGIRLGSEDAVNRSGDFFAYMAWGTPTYSVSGTVFEDLNYGGGAGRDRATSAGVARAGARVELYDAAGAFVSFTTTDGTGNYTLSGLGAGNLTVRLVNSTVSSSRAGYVPGLRGVQTYRTDASSGTAVPVTNRVGGQDPTVADAGNGGAGATMNTTTGVFTAVVSGTAQSIANATVGAANITGVDFGFNFDTIVNVNNAGQGSLRQFIDNANALSNAGLTQVGQTPGKEVSIFMISSAQLTSGIAVIVPASELPPITGANADDTSIDGTTQTTQIGDTNLGIAGTGLLGAGGTVGLGPDGVAATADEAALSQVASPEIEIKNLTTVRTGLDVQADSITIRGIAIHGFGQNIDADVDGNIRVGLDDTTDYTGTLIEQNVIGATAFEFAVPPIKTNGDGVIVRGADGGTLRGNLIGFSHRSGIKTHNDVNGWLIEGNEFRENGTTTRYGDGIDLGYDTSTATISKNLMVGNGASGVDSYESNGSNTVAENTMSGNGFAGQTNQETSAIRLFGTDSAVTLNLIQNNFGAAVLVVGDGAALNQPSSHNRISKNSFSGNGSNAIDLLAGGGDANFGDGITLNGGAPGTCSYLASTGNDGLEYPVIASASLTGGTTTIVGRACPSSEIEVYRTLTGAGDTSAGTDHGEGERYLGSTTTDGSGDFTLLTTALSVGDAVSAIVIDTNDNSSEFGPNAGVGVALSGTVFEDVNYGGGAGRDLATASADAPSFAVERGNVTVELYDAAGNLVTTTLSAVADGTYSFPGLAPAIYTVRVVSDTINSSRTGSDGSELAVQTYRIDGDGESAGTGAKKVGGELPSNENAPANSGAQTLAELQGTDLDADGVPEWTQSIVDVDLTGGGVSGVDFGFNFSTVVNTNDSGQGTLRQFVLNSNRLN